MLDLWPSLETERTMLRKVTDEDLDFIFSHFRDPNVCRYLVDNEPTSSSEEAKEIIDWCNGNGRPNSRQNRWLIMLKETGEPAGTVGFHNWDRANHIAEIGYDLSFAHWGKGMMSEVLQRVLAFGFGEMQLNRIQAFVHLQNAGSYSVLKKQGFVAEGIVRDRHLFRGKYYDHFLLALLKRDFSSRFDLLGAMLSRGEDEERLGG